MGAWQCKSMGRDTFRDDLHNDKTNNMGMGEQNKTMPTEFELNKQQQRNNRK